MTFLEWIAAHREEIALTAAILLNLGALICSAVRLWGKDKGQFFAKWLELLKAARSLEIEAEALEGLDGAEKLRYVLTRLRVLADEMELACTQEELTEAVEEDIAFSKAVNASATAPENAADTDA